MKTVFCTRNISILLIITFLLTACGFHLQGETRLAPPLQHIYLQTSDPYSYLSRNIRQYLKASNVQLATTPTSPNLILVILRDDSSQELLSVSGTQQTRQYNLKVTVAFELTDSDGRVIVDTQTLSEIRTITIQSDQTLGSSNEVSLTYQQMRHALAYGILNRLASIEITNLVIKHVSQQQTSPSL